MLPAMQKEPGGVELDELRRRAKAHLRKRMRSVRRQTPATALAERNSRLVETVLGLPEYQAASSVGLFWPILSRQEVDLRAVDVHARQAAKRVCYPYMTPNDNGGFTTGFAVPKSTKELAGMGRGFDEPPLDAPRVGRGDVDLIIVPALAAALDGHRIGYGAGYYDATLPDYAPPATLVFVLFDFQIIAEVPSFAHDVACDVIVTDRRVVQVTST